MSIRKRPETLRPSLAPHFDRERPERRRRARGSRLAVDGRLAGAMASAVFAAALGGLLVGAALPRVIADAILAPHDEVLSRLEANGPVSTAELAAAAIALRRALAVGESGSGWTALGAINVERARRIGPGPPGHDVYLDRAIAALERGLSIAPARPSAWTVLSEATLARLGASPEVAAPLGMAFRTGRVSPPLILRRLALGLTVWPVLDTGTRALIADQVRIAVDHVPAELAALARRHYLLRPIRSALASDPTRLTRFDAVYLSAG